MTTIRTSLDRPTPAADLFTIRAALLALRQDMLDLERSAAGAIDAVHPSRRESARNLVHYLALRRHDLRTLQEHLVRAGLSSLGRAEAHVLASLDAALATASRALGLEPQPHESVDRATPDHGFHLGRARLDAQTVRVLGPAPASRGVRVMVTMPGEAADDPALVRDLLLAGMDCARINCAHDEPVVWARIIRHLRDQGESIGRRCPVLMDLAGPKCRTGLLEPGPRVVKVRPKRDALGRTLVPGSACLPVPTDFGSRLRPGEELRVTDTRGSERTLRVADATPTRVRVECERTAYIATGSVLRRAKGLPGPAAAPVGDLPAVEIPLSLRPGDLLILTRGQEPGHPARLAHDGTVLAPARIPCTLPEVFTDVRAGQAVWLDDGRIGGIIESVGHDSLYVRITRAKPQGDSLRADKGINLPETTLNIRGLTADDLQQLPFIAEHADLVGMSFVREEEDVLDLQRRMAGLGRPDLGLILKIETRRGFENLPALLLAAMRSPASGVMIARGDLAIECGYERLAEVQEEILWLAEAAHMPSIWATQVLETAAKTGMPSRAEITDAAMAERAECVMLNKGPYIAAAVRLLDDILRRMTDHQSKKRSMLRRLRVAERFGADP